MKGILPLERQCHRALWPIPFFLMGQTLMESPLQITPWSSAYCSVPGAVLHWSDCGWMEQRQCGALNLIPSKYSSRLLWNLLNVKCALLQLVMENYKGNTEKHGEFGNPSTNWSGFRILSQTTSVFMLIPVRSIIASVPWLKTRSKAHWFQPPKACHK